MIENESLNRLHLIEDIMYLVNTYPEIKKSLKKDLHGWDGTPSTLYKAFVLIKAYPFVRTIHKKLYELKEKIEQNKRLGINQ